MKRVTAIAALFLVSALLLAAQTSDSSSKKKSGDYSSTSSAPMGKHVKVRNKIMAPAILVKDFKPKDIQVPAQFEVAMYENTIDAITKTGRFKTVYRDGDKRADDIKDLVILEPVIWQFKEGSARQRQVTTVKGATSLHVRVQLKDKNGNSLLDKDVTGSVHFIGENLRATNDLADNIAEMINDNF